MSKHTPGPWSLKVHDGDGKTVTANSDWSIHGPEGQVIAMEGYSNPNADGDAHLLAAAPQMYEALSELYALVKRECPALLDEDSGGDANCDMRVDAALKAASGEQE